MSKKKNDNRVPFTVYFEQEEIAQLDLAKKKSKRDGSSLIRWLVDEYASGRLVEWHVVQTENLVSLTRRLMHQAETLAAANMELPLAPMNQKADRATVRGKLTEIGGSMKDSDKPSKSPPAPK